MSGGLGRWRLHGAAAVGLLLVLAVEAVGAGSRTHTEVVAGPGTGGRSATAGPVASLDPAHGAVTSLPGDQLGGGGASTPGSISSGGSAAGPAGANPGAAAIKYDQGADDQVVRVGASTFLSGPAAVYGQQAAVGFTAGVKYVNDHGGIGGRRMVSTIYDDGADPAKMLANTKRLVEVDKVFALGLVGAAVSGPYTDEVGIPVVAEGSLDEDFTNPWYFPLGGPMVTSGMVLANYGARTLGVKKVAIFYIDAGANNFSSAYAEKLAGFWEAYGVDASTLVPFAPDQTSCSDAISAAKKANVDFVDFEIDAGHVVQCGVEAQIQGYKPPKSWGGYLIGVPVIHEALGDYSIGMYAFDAFGSDYLNPEYLADIKAVSSSVDSYSSVTMAGFISALVLADGMRQLGTDFTRVHLRDVLNTFTDYTPGLTSDPNQPRWTWTPQCHVALSGGYVIQVRKQGDGSLRWDQVSDQITATPLPPGIAKPDTFSGCTKFVPG
jgi:ABC-type branched-subunit amino acid transport system substrate-binding protein